MKNKVFILDTAFSRENGLSQGVNTTMRYLIDNRQVVMSPMDLNTLYQTKLLSMSPTNRIFEHILAEGLMDEYAVIDTSQSTQSTPELLTIPDICVDMKQFANAGMVFSSLKEYRNKIIINVAPLIQRTREGFVKLTDVNELHSQVVRGALVSSYYNCNDNIWLTPNLLKYIAQSYSMCIASQLQRIYNLDIPSQMTVAAALTWFIMNRMTDEADEMTVQCEYLGGRLAVRNMIDMFKDSVDDVSQFDLVKVGNLIASVGPDHMKGFNKDIMLKALSRMGASHISMYMALEYPPYWVYQILYALSGNKVYLSTLLQKNKLLKTAGDFLQALDTCRQFVPTVAFVTKGHSNFDGIKDIKLKNNICIYDKSRCGYSFDKDNVKYTFESINPTFGINKKQYKVFNNINNYTDINTSSTLHMLYKHGSKKMTVEEATENHCFNLNEIRISQDGTCTMKYDFTDKDKYNTTLIKTVRDDFSNIKFMEESVDSFTPNNDIEEEYAENNNTNMFSDIDVFKGYNKNKE